MSLSNTALRLAVSQSHTLPTTSETLSALNRTAQLASASSIDLLLFPEAYIGGYPRGATFGSAVGTRDEHGKEQYLRHFKDAIDLGDTPRGEGERWVRREVGGEGETARGDGTREELERIARETAVFLVVGVVERAGGTLYCGVLYVCPRLGVIGKRRKVMPTGSERLIWGQGQPSSLRAVTTTIRSVRLTLAAAICWENYMPLLRHSLYSQNVNLYLAPTADARDTWVPLMRTVACEGRCFVLSANQCIKKEDLPNWIRREKPKDVVLKGEDPKPYRFRRKSVVIDEGYEIALPGDVVKENSDENLGASDEKINGFTSRRRPSFVTENGHEIVFPASRQVSSPMKPINDIQDQTDSRKPQKQSSFETDDGHQIVFSSEGKKNLTKELPHGGEESPSQVDPARKKSVVTEHGHEIIIPTEEKRCKFGKAIITSSNGDSSIQGITPRSYVEEWTSFACRGGSCIISPAGQVLAGPLWEQEDGLLVADVDFDDCIRGRLDLDVAGSYSRNDAFKLTVEGLDLNPPA